MIYSHLTLDEMQALIKYRLQQIIENQILLDAKKAEIAHLEEKTERIKAVIAEQDKIIEYLERKQALLNQFKINE
ncbi:hypothetical protein [Pasteurella bettyae]|uniref:Uncharacterized protein n=1 Tax=Pasteurella bettyae CCUG 2042 TaxID=1095749 RepID=I3DA04_9PAST|nr:hypothetical protein [Pasteurella bettyae]EIJ68547.1 hypothetical protein HMPREF1052_1653 [Pasteurella bettyae CCUG 2042]SUB22744.1 Uncharacterised protein [Pasteurella bettyae]